MNVTTRDTLKLPKRQSLTIKLQPDLPLLPLFQRYLLDEFQYARQHEVGIIRDDNLEFLHQYRVSLRRIRSLMKQLKYLYSNKIYSAITAQIKTMMITTNQLRDLDVYLLKMDDYFDCLEHIHHQGLARFFDDLQDARKNSFKVVKRRLKSNDYKQQSLHLEDILSQDWERQKEKAESAEKHLCQAAAQKVIDQATQAVKQHTNLIISVHTRTDAKSKNSDDSQIHRLRIACKRLRYNLEYFTPLMKKGMLKEQLVLLKSLQTTLGDFNDASVQHQFLLTYQANKKPSSHRYRAISALIEITEQQHKHSRKRILKQLAGFQLTLLEQHSALFR